MKLIRINERTDKFEKSAFCDFYSDKFKLHFMYNTNRVPTKYDTANFVQIDIFWIDKLYFSDMIRDT